MLNRWLLFRFDCLGGLAVFITSVLTLASGVDGGLGGIAMCVPACLRVPRPQHAFRN